MTRTKPQSGKEAKMAARKKTERYVVITTDINRRGVFGGRGRESEMGHGTCCTCQRCKLHYDDCRCDLDESIAELDSLRAKIEKLEADVVWAVRNGACAGYDGSSWPCITYAPSGTETYEYRKALSQIEYDGTDAGLLDAVRREREGKR